MSLTAEEIAADLAAEEEQRRADRKLLAEVLAWSRVNGYGKAREYEGGRFAGYSWKAPYQKLHLDPHGDPTLYYGGHAIQPETVREAVDVLCALGVLPPEKFSSAFQAGRESVGRLIEADTETRYESEIWWDDGESEAYSHFGRTVTAESVMASAQRQLGPAGDATVVRSEAMSYEVHTYRVNEKVLGRYGDWEGVDAA